MTQTPAAITWMIEHCTWTTIDETWRSGAFTGTLPRPMVLALHDFAKTNGGRSGEVEFLLSESVSPEKIIDRKVVHFKFGEYTSTRNRIQFRINHTIDTLTDEEYAEFTAV
jgi:hypothetical protein